MEVIGTVFNGAGQVGDFRWMIEQPEYADALFIFNDNEEQFRAYRRNRGDRFGCAPGGGNAAIRPYRCTDPVRAAGIPTGADRIGYVHLTSEIREVIDDAFSVVRELVATGHYNRVIYSAADDSGQLGTGIFNVATDVKEYIVSQLKGLSDRGAGG
jgi:hypothetical protein